MSETHLLDSAIEFAKKEGKIRVTILQLKFKLGYNKATKLMIDIENLGLLKGKKGEYWVDREVKTKSS